MLQDMDILQRSISDDCLKKAQTHKLEAMIITDSFIGIIISMKVLSQFVLCDSVINTVSTNYKICNSSVYYSNIESGKERTLFLRFPNHKHKNFIAGALC